MANDATVKGGTYYPMTVKKHLRAQEIALENRLPCIYLVDSGGAYLPLQADVFPDRDHFGRIFYNQARMSAAGIPQVALVMGSCTAGGAYVPAMSDETVIVKGTGTIFLGGPPLVKAATGEDVTPEELGGSEVHVAKSGVADHEALDDEHALAIGRSIVANLNRRPPIPPWERAEPEPPAVDPAVRRPVCRGLVRPAPSRPGPRAHRPARRRLALPRVQGALRRDARDRVRPRRWLAGRHHRQRRHPVQRVGAEGRPIHRARLPAPDPLVFLQNITGFMVGREYEEAGIAKDGAKLVMAVANAEVPKFTVLIGGLRGGQLRHGRPGLPAAVPVVVAERRISVMGGPQAARVLSTVRGGFPTTTRAMPSRRRSSRRTSARAPRISRPPASGTTGSSTRWTRGASTMGIEAALHAPIPETRFGSSGCEGPLTFSNPSPWRWSSPG